MNAFDKALNYLAYRSRSTAEVRAYLLKNGFEEEDIAAAVEKLTDYKYLDDEKFAAQVTAASSRQLKGPWAAQAKLKQYGVDGEIIEKALGELCEEEQLKNATILAKKLAQRLEGQEPRKLRDKLFRRLSARGFSTEVIKSAVDAAISEELFEDEWK